MYTQQCKHNNGILLLLLFLDDKDSVKYNLIKNKQLWNRTIIIITANYKIQIG